MTSRPIALIFCAALGALGGLGIYVFLDELDTGRDIHTLVLSGLVSVVGLVCILQFLRILLSHK